MNKQRIQRKEKPVKLAFLSSGLGRISRGFEISTSTWFEHVKTDKSIHPRLFSGGNYKYSTTVWNCPRNGKIASFLRLIGVINDGCRLEQATFSFGFLMHLFFYKPHIIWVQEATLATMLLKFRKIFKFSYKLLFCDGAPVGHSFVKQFDYQIFLHQFARNEAVEAGLDSKNCVVIPYICSPAIVAAEKHKAREFLNINNDQFVVLCVAAWNTHHKRIDYLLKEFSTLDQRKMLLVLCGQEEQETPALKALALDLKINVQWHTFQPEDLSLAYLASDLFVLPSLNEGLGAVLIEAGMHGLPVICHHHQAAKFIFGDKYPGLDDLSGHDNLANKITEFRNSNNLVAIGGNTKIILEEKFNAQKLTSDFINFIDEITKARYS